MRTIRQGNSGPIADIEVELSEAVPGDVAGEPFTWSGEYYLPLSQIDPAIGFSTCNRPLVDLPVFSGTRQAIGTGAFNIALRLNGSAQSLNYSALLGGLLTASNVVEMVFGIRVSLGSATGALDDHFVDEFLISVITQGNATPGLRQTRITNGAGSVEAATDGTASLTLTGPDSGFTYRLDIDQSGDILQLFLAQDAAVNRTALAEVYFQPARVVGAPV